MVMMSFDGFCLHVDKGLSEDFYVEKRKKMAKNLSDTNKQYGMCVEYSKSEEESRKEYKEHQKLVAADVRGETACRYQYKALKTP